MSLISVSKEELAVGQPLRWTLFDQQQKVLLERGNVIENNAQLQTLLSQNPLRELVLNVSQNKPAAATSANGSAEAGSAKTQDAGFTFLDMKLRVGDRIQLQPPASLGPERYVVKLIGYVEGGSVLVSVPMSNGLRLQVREGDNIVARVFTSQTAFAFNTSIERVNKIPYDYLHLYYPDTVQGAIIRTAPRIKSRIITSVTKDGDSDKISGILTNISANGALLGARQPIAGKSQLITLSFRINLHDVDAHLMLKAIIRSIVNDEEKDEQDATKYQHGIQFAELQATDNMILQSLIYQQMIENPSSIA